MRYCSKCGNVLGEGVRFCAYCGAATGTASTGTASAGTAAAGPGTWNYMGNTASTSSGLRVRTYNVGMADYRKLNNVSLVSKPSQHIVFHIVNHLVQFILLIYVLSIFLPVCLPVLLEAEGTEIEYVPAMLPPGALQGLFVVILLDIISGIICRKIRYDIIHRLPKGFDYWQIRRMLKWHIFGLESLKTAALRILQNDDRNFPELGFGTDNEGNYHAVVVPGKDIEMFR